jgi:hypothetical protein
MKNKLCVENALLNILKQVVSRATIVLGRGNYIAVKTGQACDVLICSIGATDNELVGKSAPRTGYRLDGQSQYREQAIGWTGKVSTANRLSTGRTKSEPRTGYSLDG